ncbi:MAG: hypothetical protein RL456_883 [Pseudomonadota bacterium]
MGSKVGGRCGTRAGAAWVAMAMMLAGCATTTGPSEGDAGAPAPAGPADDQVSAWRAQVLPGKRATVYAPGQRQGRPCLQARAERSASLWRRQLRVEPGAVRTVSFSWWVPAVDPAATVAETDRDDAAARVVLAFDGDGSRLSLRNRMMFELAETLTGEAPPYATLMYVWDAHAPVGSVIVNGRSDRVRKIVVESGAQRVRDWRHYERDVHADFRMAFGEAPGALIGLAYMTDADNTQGRAEACYGRLTVR